MKVLNIVNQLPQARADGEAALVRHVPEEHVKIGHAVPHPRLKISVAHGQLIKIAEHGQILFCHHCTSFSVIAMIIGCFDGKSNSFSCKLADFRILFCKQIHFPVFQCLKISSLRKCQIFHLEGNSQLTKPSLSPMMGNIRRPSRQHEKGSISPWTLF